MTTPTVDQVFSIKEHNKYGGSEKIRKVRVRNVCPEKARLVLDLCGVRVLKFEETVPRLPIKIWAEKVPRRYSKSK